MAKENPAQFHRISEFVKGEQHVVPTYNPKTLANRELLINAWEFGVSKNGNEYVTFSGIEYVSQKPFSCTSFDKAIVAQLANYPADAPRPILGKIVEFGEYFQLA